MSEFRKTTPERYVWSKNAGGK